MIIKTLFNKPRFQALFAFKIAIFQTSRHLEGREDHDDKHASSDKAE